jgi:hypothetical protein
MAEIHVLDAYRDPAYVESLTANIVNLFAEGAEDSNIFKIYLQNEADKLQEKANQLQSLLLILQDEAVALSDNSNITLSEKSDLLSYTRIIIPILEHLIKSIQKLPAQKL